MPRWKTQVPSELDECKAYWQWAQTVPVLRDYLIKNTNEGKRTIRYGKELKDIGLRPGLPDYHLPLPNKTWNGLWIEMKRQDQKKKTKNTNQEEWLKRLSEANHYADYAYGWTEAAQITMKYIQNTL